jgi:hypothetical protein
MKIFVPVFMLCLGLTVACPAFSQKKKAKVLFDAGVAALDQKDYSKALKSFQEAYELSPHWAVLAHIGTCFVKLDQPEKAIESFQQFLEQGGEMIPPDEKRTAEDMIQQEKQKLGTLVLSVTKDGLEALVDGESVGKSPYKEVILTPGHHEIVVIFGPNDTVKRDIDLAAGQEFLLHVEQETHVSSSPVPVPEKTPRTHAVEPTPSETESVPDFNPPPGEDNMKKGSPVPFAVALGVTVADAVAVGVSWGLFGYYKQSANNYEITLDTLAAGGPPFSEYTWKKDCGDPDEMATRAQKYYCETESSRQDFADKADTWKIVGIATSSVLAVTIPLTIVFGINRHWFGGSKGAGQDKAASLSVLPLLGPNQNGLMMDVSF